jgi:hypothetical protein
MVIKVPGHVNRALLRVWRYLGIPGCFQALGLRAVDERNSGLAYDADFPRAYTNMSTLHNVIKESTEVKKKMMWLPVRMKSP